MVMCFVGLPEDQALVAWSTIQPLDAHNPGDECALRAACWSHMLLTNVMACSMNNNHGNTNNNSVFTSTITTIIDNNFSQIMYRSPSLLDF